MILPARSFINRLALAGCLGVLPAVASAQWSTTYEQFYLQADHNWIFRNRHQAADRLFNAFDFGHAILYETLWNEPNAPPARLEEDIYRFLTRKVLVKPPRVPLEEAAIEVAYARLAPEAKAMFDWAHILHRQIYDVLADDARSEAQKDSEVARVVAYYRTRPDLAFSSKPKSMALMQEQPYSLAFRKNYPKFNALIWAYHWLQVGLYEPLLVGKTPEERQTMVRATVARFWQMLERPVEWMPQQMPMTAAVAPTFTARYPEAAIIFDNLHSMHDVISDILANPSVPRNRKRAEIMIAARRFRDDTSFVVSEDAWRTMAQHMGLENMGGPPVGFLPAFPTPTVTYGAVMRHDPVTGAMTDFAYGSAIGGEHAAHGVAAPAAAAATTDTARAKDHAAMGHMPMAAGRASAGADSAGGMVMPMAHDSAMRAMHERMMADTVIMRRMMADTVMHRMMMQMMEHMSPEAKARMKMMRDSTAAKPKATPKRPATQPAPKPKPPPDPHAGHKPPG